MSNEIIKFKVKGIVRSGISVGNYLAVTKPYRDRATTYQIYILSPVDGKITGRVYGPEFSNEKEAIAMAVLLDQTYNAWLPLMEDYPHLDIIEVAKWSVGYNFTTNFYENRSGLKLAEAWKKFCKLNPPVSLSDFRILYANS